MNKIAVVFWSGTGNTESMAEFVAAGASANGADVTTFRAAEFTPDKVDEFDAIAFGCPSMGAEVLEEDEFEPMFSSCLPKLNDKKIALFGSYGWGDGEWMRDWENDCKNAGANIAHDFVICNEAPDAEAQKACKQLGVALIA
jgi:flavodoxin, short chain